MRHYVPTPHFEAILDGLLLGDGAIVRRGEFAAFRLLQHECHREWVDQVERELWTVGIACQRTTLNSRRGAVLQLDTVASAELARAHARWYVAHARRFRKRIPDDVRLSPIAVAYWLAGVGSANNNGYSIRFSTRVYQREEIEWLADKLRDLYSWTGEIFADRGRWGIRFSRSDDRCAIIDLTRPWIPSCFRAKLHVKKSRPDANRQFGPQLDAEKVAVIRARLLAGEPHALIAYDTHKSKSQIVRIATGQQWKNSGPPIRRRAISKPLTKEMLEDILLRLLKGESQISIAALHGIPQSRVCRLGQRYLAGLREQATEEPVEAR